MIKKTALFVNPLYHKRIWTITKCARGAILNILSKMKEVQYYDPRRNKTRSE